MRSFDSIGPKKKEEQPVGLDVKEIETIFRQTPSNPSSYYLYRAFQIVLSVWIVTICAIIATPWLDYLVKSTISQDHSQVLGETAPDDSTVVTPIAAANSATFYLKNEKIEINAPVVEGIDETSLSKGIGHHPDSVWFGEKGNAVLAGHNVDLNVDNPFGKVFLKLREVTIGDTVIVNYRGKNYYYKVFKSQTVSSKDTSLFGSADDWLLTFYTCDPPYTDWKRLVFQARLEKIE